MTIGDIVTITAQAKIVAVSDSHGRCYKVMLSKGTYLYPREVWLEPSECVVVTTLEQPSTLVECDVSNLEPTDKWSMCYMLYNGGKVTVNGEEYVPISEVLKLKRDIEDLTVRLHNEELQ